jgi:hypothetical protein
VNDVVDVCFVVVEGGGEREVGFKEPRWSANSFDGNA